MDRNEAKAVTQAISNGVLPGGAAVAGVIQLCAELVVAGSLTSEAAARVRDAMLADINGTYGAEASARSTVASAVRQRFAAHFPSETRLDG